MGEGRKKGPGGGGASLNFKVVGNPQPANPKENTIWLNTDAEITGHSFAAEQPEGMAEGEVWISTGTASQVAFNALKKGGTVMVYPISAKQMQGGTLVDVTAKSWQDGEWVTWIKKDYIFKDGTFYVGEMKTTTPKYLSVTGGEIKFTYSGNNGSFGYITKSKNLGNYNKLKAKIKQTNFVGNEYTGYFNMVLSVTTSQPASSATVGPVAIKDRSSAYLEITAKDGVVHELETSVAELDGEHYIEFAAVATGSIVEIWFE